MFLSCSIGSYKYLFIFGKQQASMRHKLLSFPRYFMQFACLMLWELSVLYSEIHSHLISWKINITIMAQREDKCMEQKTSEKYEETSWFILCYHANVQDSFQEHLQKTILPLVSSCRLQVPRAILNCFLFSSIIYWQLLRNPWIWVKSLRKKVQLKKERKTRGEKTH